jgi:hypothetical protein
MLISYIHTYRCPCCGAVSQGVIVSYTVVCRDSLRTSDGIGFVPSTCPACREPLTVAAHIAVADADRPKIDAARARKGWPPLTWPEATA